MEKLLAKIPERVSCEKSTKKTHKLNTFRRRKTFSIKKSIHSHFTLAQKQKKSFSSAFEFSVSAKMYHKSLRPLRCHSMKLLYFNPLTPFTPRQPKTTT
jgi:hypothetical protein